MAQEGLAQQMASPAAAGMSQMPTVEEIIQLLMEGAQPEELIQAGIPQELIMQAIQILEQQLAQQAPQQAQQQQLPPQAGPTGEAGLAQVMAG